MPEIAEVARVVHFLRLHLVGKRVVKASAQDDANVFGKVGTTGDAVAAALRGRTVVSAGSQGKYFWITLDKPPHLVMHLGMTGWVHIRGVRSAYTNYYKKQSAEDAALWPPKYTKLQLEADDGTEIAYTDPRRFGRIRLVDCAGADVRQHSPLVENGPDPVVDADRFTAAYLAGRVRARRAPIKALLLDQAVVSGIGNWVADEVLFQARLHPEQPSDGLAAADVARLHAAICDVCRTACDCLADSDRFPDHWLFNHRWGKGASKAGGPPALPNGEKLAFVTVGGRTSCYAPGLQKKKTAGRPPNEKEEPLSPAAAEEPPSAPVKMEIGSRVEGPPEPQPQPQPRKQKRSKTETDGEDEKPPKKQSKTTATTSVTNRKKSATKPSPQTVPETSNGRRRSGRLQGKVL